MIKTLYRLVNYAIYYPLFLMKRKKYIFYSDSELLDLIKNKHYSLSRFGDGEFKWIMGIEQNSFQDYDDKLANKLEEVLRSNQENLVIAIPCLINKMDEYRLEAKYYWSKFFAKHGKRIYPLLDIKKKYGNSMISRPYISYNKKNMVFARRRFDAIKSIWEQKDILIVEGEKTKIGVNNDLLNNAKTVKRVICPSRNAFSKYEEIVSSIKKNCDGRIVILALGPTATILSSELSAIGVQAIDIGHIDIQYEWYLSGTRQKIPIAGKFVNEAVDDLSGDINNTNNDNYEDQIIARVL